MNNDVFFSCKTDEWSTPTEFYTKLNDEFGFTLDPCATNENHKCEKYYTINDNGLRYSWANEIVFCNPPYSKCKEWIFKAWYEWFYNGSTIVLLVPARTDTKWFHQWVYNIAEIRFIKGRLKFGDSKNSAPFPSMLVIYRGE